jgi:lipopolysaccharide biosynthesis glycosyltransferase
MKKKIILSVVAFLYCTCLSEVTSGQTELIVDLNDVELAFTGLFDDYKATDLSGPIVSWNRLATYDQSKIINVVYVCDRKYLPYTYTSLISILQNSKPEERIEPIRFTIILDELELRGTLNKSMSKFLNAFFYMFNRDTYKYDIECIPIPEAERNRINQLDSYWWPKSIFLKLFFSNFLPYDRCLYIDGDTICISDIRELWNVDLGTHCYAACNHSSYIREDGHWVEYTLKGLIIHNAGVILMNLNRMRECGFSNILEKTVLDGQSMGKGFLRGIEGRYVEETALDEFSQKHKDLGVLELNLRFNFRHELVPISSDDGCGPFPVRCFHSDLPATVTNPIIIHYYSVNPPFLKPWRCLQQYEKCEYPDYRDSNHSFWQKAWPYNPWAFVQWYKFHKEYCEIKALAEGE